MRYLFFSPFLKKGKEYHKNDKNSETPPQNRTYTKTEIQCNISNQID